MPGVVNVDQTLDVTPVPARMAQALHGEGFADVMTSAFSRMYGQLDSAVADDLSARRMVRQDGEPDGDAAAHPVPVATRPARG